MPDVPGFYFISTISVSCYVVIIVELFYIAGR